MPAASPWNRQARSTGRQLDRSDRDQERGCRGSTPCLGRHRADDLHGRQRPHLRPAARGCTLADARVARSRRRARGHRARRLLPMAGRDPSMGSPEDCTAGPTTLDLAGRRRASSVLAAGYARLADRIVERARSTRRADRDGGAGRGLLPEDPRRDAQERSSSRLLRPGSTTPHRSPVAPQPRPADHLPVPRGDPVHGRARCPRSRSAMTSDSRASTRSSGSSRSSSCGRAPPACSGIWNSVSTCCSRIRRTRKQRCRTATGNTSIEPSATATLLRSFLAAQAGESRSHGPRDPPHRWHGVHRDPRREAPAG